MSDETPARRCYLYSDEHPEGRIFEGDAIEQALEDGWKETPPDYAGDAPVANPQTLEAATAGLESELKTAHDQLDEADELNRALQQQLEAEREAHAETKRELATVRGQLTKAQKAAAGAGK